MADITTRSDIEVIMDRFYAELLKDETINYIFTDIAKINLEEHLPVICDFWETIIIGNQQYKGDVLSVHLNLNNKVKLEKYHFHTWLQHFNRTIDQHYKGLNADKMKMRAASIATVIQSKIYLPS